MTGYLGVAVETRYVFDSSFVTRLVSLLSRIPDVGRVLARLEHRLPELSLGSEQWTLVADAGQWRVQSSGWGQSHATAIATAIAIEGRAERPPAGVVHLHEIVGGETLGPPLAAKGISWQVVPNPATTR